MYPYEDIVEGLQRSEPFNYKIWALVRVIKAHSRTVLPVWFTMTFEPLPCTHRRDHGFSQLKLQFEATLKNIILSIIR